MCATIILKLQIFTVKLKCPDIQVFHVTFLTVFATQLLFCCVSVFKLSYFHSTVRLSFIEIVFFNNFLTENLIGLLCNIKQSATYLHY